MILRLKTRERIVRSSLELFNQQGERSVSTNHIAAHLEMSPGNLYYHFANKQEIVAVLFAEFEARVNGFLQPTEDRLPTINDMRDYLQSLLEVMWNYRFFYRDLEHLLDSDPALAIRYQLFAGQSLQRGQAIYRGFVQAGLLAVDENGLQALAVNAWIVATSWIRYLCTSSTPTTQLSEQALKRGVYQVLMLQSGHVTAQWCDAVQRLAEEFYVPLNRAPSAEA
ncbi:TetR/AcrR family transcriptional regulator [Pseudomonas sp. dw_358]|uniref:TetR/AcrR family transcriptional regulator n=1 Tax=Pseudomonas sp. dw_358 TaxID=2720083 RepID=UPI001BD2E242|nr:TetR/AcrR family transcriptional regulator [Pseudomonas sp. dw_358]